MDDFSLNPFWIFIQSTDWITVACFYAAGIWFGWRIHGLRAQSTTQQMELINAILKRLKMKARKFYGRHRVTLDDILAMINGWRP